MSAAIFYRSVASPLGELFLAETAAGLCRVAWCVTEAEFATELEDGLDAPARRDDSGAAGVVARAARQLDEYFAGQRREFELPLDLAGTSPFRQQVLQQLLQVPYGEVVTYGELALLCGMPRAARAVGGAMRANPLPVVIPCHRVLPCSGGLGGFGGRPELKRQLLEIEGWTETGPGMAASGGV